MLKRIIIIILLFFTFIAYSYSAATTGGGTKSNYDKAALLIKSAKKYEIKGKDKRAKKRYERALKFLIKSNKDKPNQADTLNYLGFATRKLGDFKKGEEYYLLGLKIDPTHNGINEYLGELYFITGRIDLAKERLSILKGCSCEEYSDLKEIIEGKKQSKY